MKKKGLKCVCGRTAREAKLLFLGHETGGWKCSCGQEYHDPEQAEKILLLNKLKKTRFEVTLGQIRSNLIIRIPKEVATALNLKKGEQISLSIPSEKKIEITAV